MAKRYKAYSLIDLGDTVYRPGQIVDLRKLGKEAALILYKAGTLIPVDEKE